MRFSRAIVREPGPSFIHGLTTAQLGIPDYQLALKQHQAYVRALKECGLAIIELPPDDKHPDSTFVEDTALLTPRCAIIMRPGAPARRDETISMEEVITEFFSTVERVEPPGTADAGDIMMVGHHYYIGLSQRTNLHGATQIIDVLQSHGMTGSTIPLKRVLHLKSGVAFLENNTMLIGREFSECPEFKSYELIEVDDDESYAANSLWVNGMVLVATGYPRTERAIRSAGFRAVTLDVSEFRKLDGGLSCLSLRF